VDVEKLGLESGARVLMVWDKAIVDTEAVVATAK